jgi:hypothetical protein
MAHARFTANYDHKWPSGCVTAYKAGYEGTVKAEVLAGALAAKKAVDLDAKGEKINRKDNPPAAQDILIAEKNEVIGVGPTDPKEV